MAAGRILRALFKAATKEAPTKAKSTGKILDELKEGPKGGYYDQGTPDEMAKRVIDEFRAKGSRGPVSEMEELVGPAAGDFPGSAAYSQGKTLQSLSKIRDKAKSQAERDFLDDVISENMRVRGGPPARKDMLEGGGNQADTIEMLLNKYKAAKGKDEKSIIEQLLRKSMENK
jgi:hypothetical protein